MLHGFAQIHSIYLQAAVASARFIASPVLRACYFWPNALPGEVCMSVLRHRLTGTRLCLHIARKCRDPSEFRLPLPIAVSSSPRPVPEPEPQFSIITPFRLPLLIAVSSNCPRTTSVCEPIAVSPVRGCIPLISPSGSATVQWFGIFYKNKFIKKQTH